MHIKDRLIEQIKLVISTFEEKYKKNLNNGILELLYKRYLQALQILNQDGDAERIKIKGGVRAYLDTYSDYQNPLLDKMYEAEKLYNALLTTKNS